MNENIFLPNFQSSGVSSHCPVLLLFLGFYLNSSIVSAKSIDIYSQEMLTPDLSNVNLWSFPSQVVCRCLSSVFRLWYPNSSTFLQASVLAVGEGSQVGKIHLYCHLT